MVTASWKSNFIFAILQPLSWSWHCTGSSLLASDGASAPRAAPAAARWRVSMINFKNVSRSPRSVFRFVHQLVITSLAELKTCSEWGLGKGKLKQLTAVRDEADYAVLFWNEDSVIPAGFWNRRSHEIMETDLFLLVFLTATILHSSALSCN